MSDRKILVLEKESYLSPHIRESCLHGTPGCHVLDARTVPQAMQILHDQPVDVVVSSHEGPLSIDGLELLQSIRKADLPVRVILVADPTLEDDRNPALAAGCSCFVPKSVPVEKFAQLVVKMLQSHQGFAGRVIDMRLEDIIQMFCYRNDSTLLSVFHQGSIGDIYVQDGGIVHAQCDSTEGVDAFYDILAWESGHFVSQVVFSVPEQTIFVDSQTLLMEGVRQKDEIRHALAPLPDVEKATEDQPVPEGRTTPPEVPEARKRIMVVDDSRFIRKIVQELIEGDSSLSVVGFASNGQEALAKIDELKPDLILLDWDMPVMKGSTTLMHIMIKSPCPVVILSGFGGGVGANPVDLLCLGGVDFLRKPQSNWRMDGRADDLVRRVREACSIKYDRIRRVRIPPQVADKPNTRSMSGSVRFLAVIGSSIGGFSDLVRLIPFLPHDLPAAVVVIHDMQKETLDTIVDYLDRRSRIKVQALIPGEALVEGVCYIHPARIPVVLITQGDGMAAELKPAGPEEIVLDKFLVSASEVMGNSLLAVLLSGRFGQGIEGLRAVRNARGITMVQDPLSCSNPGMAEDALQQGVVDWTASAETLARTFEQLITSL